ncbi:MAG: ABC transporter ATP-binding protein [Alcanivorax sp.]|nr:ABC transporter ATP-binding protein [Alcanivorax sp.]
MSALTLRNLTKTYANGVEALKGIDLTVERGDFFALLGPNGAGKSTTIGIVSSLVNKTGGEVTILGHSLDQERELAKQKIGVVPQEFNFSQFEKVFDIVVTQAGFYGIPAPLARQRAEKYLRKLGLWDKRKNQARSLSGGMKRRLMIARAMIHDPKVLILDEPTAGVDIEMRRSMYEFLRELNENGTTIILTTHYLEEAEALCRNIAIINHGTIVTNSSIKDLLKGLHKETFILDVEGEAPEDVSVEGYEISRMDEHCLEVVIEKGQDLAPVFVALKEKGIAITSMRNRENRLEQMFVSLLEASA